MGPAENIKRHRRFNSEINSSLSIHSPTHGREEQMGEGMVSAVKNILQITVLQFSTFFDIAVCLNINMFC